MVGQQRNRFVLRVDNSHCFAYIRMTSAGICIFTFSEAEEEQMFRGGSTGEDQTSTNTIILDSKSLLGLFRNFKSIPTHTLMSTSSARVVKPQEQKPQQEWQMQQNAEMAASRVGHSVVTVMGSLLFCWGRRHKRAFALHNIVQYYIPPVTNSMKFYGLSLQCYQPYKYTTPEY